MQLSYTVLKEDNGKKVGTILRERFSISSRLLNKLKMNEKILVNQTPVFSSYLVHENDHITVNIDFEEQDGISKENIPLRILWEDEYLLAVNKPAHMVVHPSSYHPNGTLANAVKFYLNNQRKIRPINRLDRDTSGIVLFAKNEYIQELMIQNHSLQKEYLAICINKLPEQTGTISAPIAREDGSIMLRKVSEEGQVAITHYDVMKYFPEDNLSLVHLKLETGRTHQIRVHMKYIGNPILGDSLYGCPSSLISRQALHAWKLSFIHPITKKKILIETSLPEDMENIVQKFQ